MVAGAGSPASTPAAAQRCRHRSTTTGVEMFSIVALHVAAADLKAPARGRFVWRWRAGCGAHHQARFHSGTILCADRENRTVHGVQGVGVRIIELESWRARRGRVFFFFFEGIVGGGELSVDERTLLDLWALQTEEREEGRRLLDCYWALGYGLII